jgi:hypothetical protein
MSHVRIDIERAHVFKRCMERAAERDQIQRIWKEIHDPLLVHVTASITWIMYKARKDRLVIEQYRTLPNFSMEAVTCSAAVPTAYPPTVI